MPADLPQERLLTVAQVAHQLAISTRTVQRWARDGTLKAIRLPSGRGYRIYQKDLEYCLQTKDPDGWRFYTPAPWIQSDPPEAEWDR